MMLKLIGYICVFILIGGCSNNYQREQEQPNAAMQALKARDIPVTLDGLKQSTRSEHDDGAQLFDRIGYFDDISKDEVLLLLEHVFATNNHGLYQVLEQLSSKYQFHSNQLIGLLHRAIEGSRAPMAALFIKFGQRPDADAILEASYRNDYALMATLLAAYPYLDEEVFAEPLPMAARLGNVNAVKAMLDTRKAPLKYLHKALILASLREEMAVVKYLIAAGVDINARDPQGCTALHYLAADATVESVQYLLDKGAAINVTCRGRQTPLNWAYSGNSSGVIDLLIRNGAVKY